MSRFSVKIVVLLICLIGVVVIFESCQLDKVEENRNMSEESANRLLKRADKFTKEFNKIDETLALESLKELPKSIQNKISDPSFQEEYQLSAWINPNYQIIDFEGDENPEYVILIINRINGKKGLVIVGNSKLFIIGAGKEFGTGGDDFRWMDYWTISNQKTLEETIVEGGEIQGVREVKNPSEALFVKEMEGTGAYIIKEDIYKWLLIE